MKRKNPFKPIGISQKDFELLFEEIEPIEQDGHILKRCRFRIETGLQDGPILTQCPPAKLIPLGKIKKEPMKIPYGSIFYLEYKYGK